MKTVVYIRMIETYDLGTGRFKASFVLLWLFHPSVGALPAMPLPFGGTGWLRHLLQQEKGAENSERCLSDLHRNNPPKEFW